MKEICKDLPIKVQHMPGKGSWTYHIILPNTKDIKGRAGRIRVSGTIDHYRVENRSLVLVTNGDKLLSVNSDIRKTLNKGGGDVVNVSMYLVSEEQWVGENDIRACFLDAEVLDAFESLDEVRKLSIIEDIVSRESLAAKEARILWYIDHMGNLE